MRCTTTCPECRTHIQANYKNNRWVKWIDIECHWCGYKKKIKEDEIDMIQPNSDLWDLVYGNNIFEKTKKERKRIDWEKEKKKEELDKKYDKQFKKPWERKFVKDKVLKEKF